MRILIINYEFPPIGAGGGKASQKIAESLVAMGHTVRVVTSRPTQLYDLTGNLLLLLGFVFWVYLAFLKITIDEDISDHGFTILGTLCLLTGFILRNTALTWALLSPIRGLKALEFINGIEVRRVPVFRRRQDICTIFEMGTFVLSAIWYCLRTSQAFQPDVVHIFFAIPDGPIGWVLKRTHKLPYLISLRGADVPTDEVKRFALAYKILQLRPIFAALAQDAEAVVSVSNGLRSQAHEITADIPIEVITNAIELNMFTPPAHKPPLDVVRLIYVGRLTASKDPFLLIKAIQILETLDDVAPFALELLGDGDLRPQLEKMILSQDLTHRVFLRGWVDRAYLVQHYQQSHIFVTGTIWEGMPNTVLEAMACGLAVVGTDAPGMDQLVREGRNGYLVPTKDAAALASRLQLLINNPIELARMGTESRKMTEHEFTWDHITQQYVQIYERIAAK